MNTQIKISILILFFISVSNDSISKESKKDNYKNFTCKINFSESPDMFNFSKKVEKLFNKNYLSIYKRLNAKENQAPQKVHIIFNVSSEPTM